MYNTDKDTSFRVHDNWPRQTDREPTDREQTDREQTDREQRRLAEKGDPKYIFNIPRAILPKPSLCDEITATKTCNEIIASRSVCSRSVCRGQLTWLASFPGYLAHSWSLMTWYAVAPSSHLQKEFQKFRLPVIDQLFALTYVKEFREKKLPIHINYSSVMTGHGVSNKRYSFFIFYSCMCVWWRKFYYSQRATIVYFALGSLELLQP